MTRNLQHAGADRRENAFNGFDNPMIERVHRTTRIVLANDAHDERLNARRFDLDVNHRVGPDCVEHGGEGRNLNALAESKISELCERQLGDGARRQIGGIYNRIVVNDDSTVAGAMDIQLDRLRSQLNRAQECRDGVLGQGLMRSPVGDFFRRSAPTRCVQAFLRVVALGTMSAKL